MEMQEWIKINIKDPLPMDDKSRLYELLNVLSDDNSCTAYKDFAIKGLGMMATKYGTDSIILCGALSLIKDQLSSSNPILIAQSIRTLTCIANNGGDQDIIQEKLHILVRNIISEKSTPNYVKEMGLPFYFKISDMEKV